MNRLQTRMGIIVKPPTRVNNLANFSQNVNTLANS